MAEGELKPAAENPWYVLATIAGEQEFDGPHFDWDVGERNARVWNAWACQELSDLERQDLAEALDLDAAELAEWPAVKAKVKKVFRERIGEGAELPEPEDIDFSSTQFSRPVSFARFVFPHLAVFDDAAFAQGAGFAGARFQQLASFRRTKFGKRRITDFQSSRFLGEADFEEAEFLTEANFTDATFDLRVNFSAARFRKFSEFSSTAFGDDVEFERASFEGDVYFQEANFGRNAYFANSKFDGDASFRDANFRSTASFLAVGFGGETYFVDADFGSDAAFEVAAFEGAAFFMNITVAGHANFGGADFGEAFFCSGSTFTGFTDFVRTRFCMDVDLKDCQFERSTSFRIAVFEQAYPTLSGADLHDHTHFTARDVPHDEDEDKTIRYWPMNLKDPNASRNACGIIRHVVGQQGRPEDEHFFFRKEMYFAGRTDEPFLTRFPYLMFGWVSEFGYSIARPAWLLAVLWAVGFAAFWGYLVQASAKTPVFTALGISFSNVFPFFGTRSLFAGAGFFASLPEALVFLSAIQTVLGILLLFFLGLGLRTRFRLR